MKSKRFFSLLMTASCIALGGHSYAQVEGPVDATAGQDSLAAWSLPFNPASAQTLSDVQGFLKDDEIGQDLVKQAPAMVAMLESLKPTEAHLRILGAMGLASDIGQRLKSWQRTLSWEAAQEHKKIRADAGAELLSAYQSQKFQDAVREAADARADQIEAAVMQGRLNGEQFSQAASELAPLADMSKKAGNVVAGAEQWSTALAKAHNIASLLNARWIQSIASLSDFYQDHMSEIPTHVQVSQDSHGNTYNASGMGVEVFDSKGVRLWSMAQNADMSAAQRLRPYALAPHASLLSAVPPAQSVAPAENNSSRQELSISEMNLMVDGHRLLNDEGVYGHNPAINTLLRSAGKRFQARGILEIELYGHNQLYPGKVVTIALYLREKNHRAVLSIDHLTIGHISRNKLDRRLRSLPANGTPVVVDFTVGQTGRTPFRIEKITPIENLNAPKDPNQPAPRLSGWARFQAQMKQFFSLKSSNIDVRVFKKAVKITMLGGMTGIVGAILIHSWPLFGSFLLLTAIIQILAMLATIISGVQLPGDPE